MDLGNPIAHREIAKVIRMPDGMRRSLISTVKEQNGTSAVQYATQQVNVEMLALLQRFLWCRGMPAGVKQGTPIMTPGVLHKVNLSPHLVDAEAEVRLLLPTRGLEHCLDHSEICQCSRNAYNP